MNTTFLLNGGAGRIITAIPALEKYQKLNPTEDFKILIMGWESLLWSHPTLQNKTFTPFQKGQFDLIKNTKIVSPEPYHVHGYYNQQISLAQAFDEIINNTHDHDDLDKPNLYLSTFETLKIQEILSGFKNQHKKSKVIVIQPYGSTAEFVNNTVIDKSARSLSVENYLSIVNHLKDDCIIIYFGESRFKSPLDQYSISTDHMAPDLRMYMGLISECDYFVGIDSVGQHIARAFNKPGLIMMGGTHEINVTYPNHFTIYRNKNRKPIYSPLRLIDADTEFADRQNDGILNFDSTQITEITTIIKNHLNPNINDIDELTDLGINYS
jgi:hypothetical protein